MLVVPWFVLVGVVLIAMAFSSHFVQRMPLSPAIVYLCVGALIGPVGVQLLHVDPLLQTHRVELLTEVAVLITLFAVGLRLHLPFRWSEWRLPVRLASLAMLVTTTLITLAAVLLLDLPPAAALLLAAILAPTDPVLASDVQIQEPGDRDKVRVAITAEGGLNDGAAFPLVMLALGLLGLHPIGTLGWRWIAVDLVWAVSAGLGLGWACGVLTGIGVRKLRASGHVLESEEFLVFGLIALTYGLALLLHAYGFLAVFAAGVALKRSEQRESDDPDPAIDASHTDRLSNFSGKVERLAEVAVVLLIGAALAWVRWDAAVLAFAVVVLAIARPLAVLAVSPGSGMSGSQRRLVAWFGIRGVGSVYYMSFAAGLGLDRAWSHTLASAVVVTIALSIVVHGVSATPLMARYRRRRAPAQERRERL